MAHHLPTATALSLIWEARRDHPDAWCLQKRAAWLLARAGRCGSVPILERIVALQPEAEDARSALAACYDELGRTGRSFER